MSLKCPTCGYEFDDREVEDSYEAAMADSTPMFVAWKKKEHETFGTGGEATYICSPECMAGYLAENHGDAE